MNLHSDHTAAGLTTAGVSVLICCYNSASRLPATLRHLALQDVRPAIDWEIIVVDNASTDDTAEVANKEWDRYQLPKVAFKVVNEPKPGKHNALNTGIGCSTYEYVIICDDDNWLNNDYIGKAYEIMRLEPLVGAAGGQGIAITEMQLPDWFGRYQYAYAVGKQRERTGYLPYAQYIWGAGMVFRKSLYKKVYKNLPSFLTGPHTDTLARGEDVEFCFRIQLAGCKLYYNDGLIFKHYMPAERLTTTYQRKLLGGSAFESRILNLYTRQIKINNLPIYKKTLLLCLVFIRYVVSRVFPDSKWVTSYESESFYQFTGFRLSDVADDTIKIRKLSQELSARKQALNV
ncbi:glycosyltransferase [Mucilaginibacter aquariorum]|uniref:Glycosyltransferase n=1 Tax=Mucilaginibacter aquariorum TaxID=2967225 RepID=A0ABT1SYE7_9SPHI|nr:glycosyltransferase [Mucilaginibacter aquariorum]MCQ6957277.1 glycosyltransferase [Mucilaginibacter aquariorum]